MRPLQFVRSRFHRRLFAWFGLAIFFCFAAVTAVLHLMGSGPGGSGRELDRVARFAQSQFARVWDSPAERHALAESVAKDLRLEVRVTDASGRTLEAFGACERPALVTDVTRGAEVLGSVRVCLGPERPSGGHLLIALFAAGAVLWAISGVFARRFARPLVELARFTSVVGRGDPGGYAAHHAPHHHRCQNYGRSRDEVGVLYRAVYDMAARIHKQLSDQRELLAAVSHEIRTPLARIRLLVEMLRTGAEEDPRLDSLDQEVVEIDRLVAELLANARIEFSALRRASLAPQEVAARALERAGLDPTLARCEPDLPALLADPTLLARALSNLLENAQRHGGGVVALRARRADEAVSFEVDDAGPGLAPGQEAHIFEPFYKHGEGGSLGLGLALVQRIAEAHGGRTFARNRAEGGATIGLELPLSEES